jgi:integrase
MPNYLRKRGRRYHYTRRISKHLQHLFLKKVIEVPLQTDSKSIALQRAQSFNYILEDFFDSLHSMDKTQIERNLIESIKDAKINNFRYIPIDELTAKAPLSEFVNHINLAHATNDHHAKQVFLGTLEHPSLTISKALEEYFEFEISNLPKRSENQIRKWKNPRKKAVKNFISVIGDKPIEDIHRKDILALRKWWNDRILSQGLTANSANKEFGKLRQIIRTIADNHMLEISTDDLFKNITLKNTEKTRRYPLSIEFIQQHFIDKDLSGLNAEARLFILAMIDTGARISELTGLDIENGDIVLDGDIPHIKIRPNSIRSLKTPQSERDIPLVGTSLYAFQNLEKGFNRYLGKSDLISNTINKYLRDNRILPSKNHSLYSLRHSFEDRLTAVEPPDKVQAALMGHKYSRPRYGLGPTLTQKKQWLDKIVFNK